MMIYEYCTDATHVYTASDIDLIFLHIAICNIGVN